MRLVCILPNDAFQVTAHYHRMPSAASLTDAYYRHWHLIVSSRGEIQVSKAQQHAAVAEGRVFEVLLLHAWLDCAVLSEKHDWCIQDCAASSSFQWEETNSAAGWEELYGWPPDPMWTESNWPPGQPSLQLFQVCIFAPLPSLVFCSCSCPLSTCVFLLPSLQYGMLQIEEQTNTGACSEISSKSKQVHWNGCSPSPIYGSSLSMHVFARLIRMEVADGVAVACALMVELSGCICKSCCCCTAALEPA